MAEPKIALMIGTLGGNKLINFNMSEEDVQKTISDHGYNKVGNGSFVSENHQEGDNLEIVFDMDGLPVLLKCACSAEVRCYTPEDANTGLVDDLLIQVHGITAQTVFTEEWVEFTLNSFTRVESYLGTLISFGNESVYYNALGKVVERPENSILKSILRKDKYRAVDCLVYSVGEENSLNIWNTCLGVLYSLDVVSRELSVLISDNVPRELYYQVKHEEGSNAPFTYVNSIRTGFVHDGTAKVYDGSKPDVIVFKSTAFGDTGIAHHPSIKLMTGVQYRKIVPVTTVKNSDIVICDNMGNKGVTIYDEPNDRWIRTCVFSSIKIEEIVNKRNLVNSVLDRPHKWD